MDNIRRKIREFGMPRIIIIAFIFVILIGAMLEGQDMAALISDSLVRVGQNMILALAMLPAILVGAGLNMGLAIGIVCGLLAGLLSIQWGLMSWSGILMACLLALVFGSIVGVGYGKLLNLVRGSEMLIGNYLGSSVVYLMCMFWFAAPFTNPTIIWPMGGTGVRTTVPVSEYYEKVFNRFLAFKIGGVTIPTGLFLFVFLMCFLVYLFTKSKSGITLRVVGNNPSYAAMFGVNVNRARLIGIALSTALGSLGIVVYAQSYGFYQTYEGPLTMAFTPMAAILLGGATMRSVKIRHVIIGTFLIQTLLTTALPVSNQLFPESNLSEVFRIIISNGIILYALSQAGGNEK
ncbi:ABC transporter permease [Oscillibacter sp.]|uniref:ABC transporter permease subunit n=1 Tax=Oscillibacter sp. TaxID=1945593 RepID=UPI0033987F73